MTLYLDEKIKNADWNKRTPDLFDRNGRLIRSVKRAAKQLGISVSEFKKLPAYTLAKDKWKE